MTETANNTSIDKPLLSIITVCRNVEGTIVNTIESILRQTFTDYEYIIVDGASTDGTIKIIESYSPKIKYISEPDEGYTEAINKGISMAKGKWIHLLNADDSYISRDSLGRVIPNLLPDRLNYCPIVRQWHDGTSKRLPIKYESLWPFRNKRWHFWITTSMLHPVMIIAREQYEKVGKYDSRWHYSADIDMILRLLKVYPLNYIPKLFVQMRQGGMSQQNRRETAHEFAEICIDHGMPRFLAVLIYQFKIKFLIPLLLMTDRIGRKRIEPEL